MRFSLRAILCGAFLILGGMSDRAQSAVIPIGSEEFSKIIAELSPTPKLSITEELAQLAGEAARMSAETSVAASQTEPVQTKPASQPQPQPALLSNPLLAGQASGSSMSGTSAPSVSSPGGVPAGDAQAPIILMLTSSGAYLCLSDWLFIPPRFLDGVFRPPRQIVSL